MFEMQIAIDYPSCLTKPLAQSSNPGSSQRIALGIGHENAQNSVRLLCARRERPRHRASEQRHKIASLQSIELHAQPQPGTEAAYPIGEDQVRGLLRCEISIRPESALGQNLNPPF
jgi:hypothetical protein